MKLVLNRNYYVEGTNGDLFFGGDLICYTIELPLTKYGDHSCIPEGRYCLQISECKEYGKHLIVQGVPGNDKVLIHAAEDALEELTYGSIAPVDTLYAPGVGYASDFALKDVIDLLEEFPNEEHELVVTSVQNN